MKRTAAYSVALTLCAMALAPGMALAEIDDLSLATLEYAADFEGRRGIKLEPVPQTVRVPASKIAATARKVDLPLDPRPALQSDSSLYQSLGLLPPGDAGARIIKNVSWPRLKALYTPDDEGGRLLVAAGAARADHVISVGIAALLQRVDTDIIDGGGHRDRQLAVQSMLLGDAIYYWLSKQEGQRPSELLDRIRWGREHLDSVLGRSRVARRPSTFVTRLVNARYYEGLAAVTEVRETSPWGVVDEMYRQGRPRSTAQLLHPKLMILDRLDRDLQPTKIAAFQDRGEPTAGTIGELRLRLWLESWLDVSVAQRATTGWASDTYHLYPGRETEEPTTLVLLTTWDEFDEPAEAEALDFAGAVKVAQAKRLGRAHKALPDGLAEGATGWVDKRGMVTLIEQREDKVLFVTGCPLPSIDQVREEVWTGWKVGRVDLSAVGDIRPTPPPPIAQMPPEVPWYHRTPGYIAMLLWLAVLLPAIAFGVGRKTPINPVKVYVYGLAATLVLIVLVWILGS